MKVRWLVVPALLALSVMGAAPRHAELPPLPAFVYSRYGPVPVVRTPVVVCGDPTPPNVVGCYSATEHRIQIADSLDIRFATFVLEHEKFHVAMRDLHVEFDDSTSEDRLANVVARYRLGELEGHP